MDLEKMYFTLDENHVPVEAKSLMEFHEWMMFNDPLVALAEFEHGKVSTVFLGRNHNWNFEGEPILFETLITGFGDLHGDIYRYSSWDEALSKHNAICQNLIDAHLCISISEELMGNVQSRLLITDG